MRFLKNCLIGCGVFVLAAAALGWLGVRWVRNTYLAPAPPAPKIGARTALRPEFILRSGKTLESGTAVITQLKPGGAPIVLTALHLFGPAGGLDADLSPAQVGKVVKEVRLTPISGGKPVAMGGKALRTTGAALVEDSSNVSNDVAAFAVSQRGKADILPLAADNPGAGEWIWLVGDAVDHHPQQQRLFAGQVIFGTDDGMVVRLTERFPLQAFSGAPLINTRGEVVGLLISGGERGGIIHPAGSIRKRLAESGFR
jgi:hypothetical protein